MSESLTHILGSSNCSRLLKNHLALCVILSLLSVPLMGQEVEVDSGQLRIEKFDAWKWRISPYAWIPAISGSISTPTVPDQLPTPPPPIFDFTILIKDLRSHLKFLSVMSAEYHSGRFMVIGTFDALVIGAKPVLILENLIDANLDFGLYASDLTAGYRFLRRGKIQIDGMGGLRFLHIKAGLDVNVLGLTFYDEIKTTYFDPLIALRFHYLPHYRVEWTVVTDYTPIATKGTSSFQAISVITYQFSPHFFLSPGYRFVAHHKKDPEITYFDGNVRGFYLRIGFQF